MLAKYDVTSDEFTEVIALHMTSPEVGDRIDYGLAQVCAVMATSAMGSKKRFAAAEFVPKWGHKPAEKTDADVVDIFRQIARSRGS
jgi:hypothetical protein